MTNHTKNSSLKVKDGPRENKMPIISEKSVDPEMKENIPSDQLAVTEVLVSDWLECQSVVPDKRDDDDDDDDDDDYDDDDDRDGETGWSSEEDEGVSEMSSENRELWEAFLNHSDPYNPLHFSCPTEDKVKASDNDHHDDDEEEDDEEEPVSRCPQKKDETEWSEEEESVWSDEEDLKMSAENRELWESFVNKSDPFDPLCFSCSTGVKVKASENHTVSSPTASDVEDNPEQNTKERATKVRFSEEVTIHYIEWNAANQAARDGSCWMEMARDRDRFKRRVEQIGEIISPCLTAQHRAKVLDRLSNHSDNILAVQCRQTTKYQQKTEKIMAAISIKILLWCLCICFKTLTLLNCFNQTMRNIT
ncbi:protein phosphatase 1 regulatory subunit 15A [Ictalurus furcatus]|uniref:protein phosphatase 1 regulatory subunit 15A n=1 Tax=Ictalurus furcatus TaxID=66913 RepID=UPI00234FD06F|nr:protein phosphatase 1 regulatory subunit 15A [Ictalurus furcatus]XP_053484945.1 protein phosphatase 1 regulatory subunit 15A [Ictalurus furcatus]XP_053484946.1 protein phosphatase 1 regulatory subunit 15A [Ictalurus furcatus]